MMSLLWRLLGWHLLLAIFSVGMVVAVSGWLLSDYWQQKEHYEQQYMTAKQAIAERETRAAYQDIASHILPDVEQFRHQGWIGHQSRVGWIDHIVALSRDAVLDGVQLRFSERIPLVKERVAGVNQVPSGVNTEVLSAEAFFMHEWDALQWIERIQKDQGMPLSLLTSCQLKLMSVDEVARAEFPVFASCRWLLFEVLE